MGLAASQARLLTLSSRMNDLELQCQTLSMQKLRMTAEGGKISREYNSKLQAANAIGPEEITTITTTTGSTYTYSQGQSVEEYKLASGGDFTYANLKNAGYDIGCHSVPKSFADQYNQPSGSSDSGNTGKTPKLEVSNSVPVLFKDKFAMANTLCSNGFAIKSSAEEGKVFLRLKHDFSALSPEFIINARIEAGELFPFFGDPNSASIIQGILGGSEGTDGSGGTDDSDGTDGSEGSTQYTEDEIKSMFLEHCKTASASYLIDQIILGNITITQGGSDVDNYNDVLKKETTETEAGGETLTERYETETATKSLDYSARNAAREAAQAWYDEKQQDLSRRESAIDMKMQNANTEYQAVCTEYDSVKGLIDKNAERSFTLFG